jgi:hypothetical protein
LANGQGTEPEPAAGVRRSVDRRYSPTFTVAVLPEFGYRRQSSLQPPGEDAHEHHIEQRTAGHHRQRRAEVAEPLRAASAAAGS